MSGGVRKRALSHYRQLMAFARFRVGTDFSLKEKLEISMLILFMIFCLLSFANFFYPEFMQ